MRWSSPFQTVKTVLECHDLFSLSRQLQTVKTGMNCQYNINQEGFKWCQEGVKWCQKVDRWCQEGVRWCQAQPSATCILNIALPTRDRCDKF